MENAVPIYGVWVFLLLALALTSANLLVSIRLMEYLDRRRIARERSKTLRKQKAGNCGGSGIGVDVPDLLPASWSGFI
jgi:hypothetical protein